LQLSVRTKKVRRILSSGVVVGLAALSFGLAACSSAPTAGSDPSRTSMETRINTFLAGPPVTTSGPTATTLGSDACPYTDVRDGTAVHRIGGDNAAEVRYQATIVDTARECRLEGNTVIIKVGVEGRVVVGPKGGAGRVTLPLRIALTRGLNEAVWTKLYTVSIDVPAGAPSVAFTQVEEGMQVPLPADAKFDDYRIFVGFDANAPAAKNSGRRRR
jgi:hypothetical protein